MTSAQTIPNIPLKEREYTDAELNNIQTKLKELKLKGRLMPDSALTTYFGKPAFHAYGNGNTEPAQGGLIYGDYMKSHNVNPHSGENHPENHQCYARAMRGHQVIVPQKEGTKADKKKIVMQKKEGRKPEPPRQAPLKRPLTASALQE